MNLKDLCCKRDDVLETASCRLIAPEPIGIWTGWVELQPDDRLAFHSGGMKYWFDLTDASQKAKVCGLLRAGRVCVAQKLSQIGNSALFDLKMVLFASYEMKGEVGIVLEEPVLASFRKKYPNRSRKVPELRELLTMQVGGRSLFAYAVRKPYKEEEPASDPANKADPAPEAPEEPAPEKAAQAAPETPEQAAPETSEPERTFQIYGQNCMLQVEMAGEGEEAYLSGRKLVWNPKNIPALRLADGPLCFSDQRTQAALRVRQELQSSPGYLKLWNEYSEQEGELLLQRARNIGRLTLERGEHIGMDGKKLIIFLRKDSKENAEALKQLEAGDCLAFSVEEPPYLENREMTWKEYETQKEVRTRERKRAQDDTPWEIPMRIESVQENERKIVLMALKSEDDPRPETLNGRVISLSIYGDARQIERRKKSRDLILNGEAANPNIACVIEGIPYRAAARHKRVAPLSPRVTEKVFRNDPTLRQTEAVDIALNTPDIAIIQGPPGTGKTTVITAIIERLNELADKTRSQQGEVLVTSLQHDAVANIQSRLHINSLPTVKFGKRAGEESDLDESVEKWRLENIEKLRQSSPMLRESDSEKDLDRAFYRYTRTPSVHNAWKFLQCVKDTVLQEEVQESVRAIWQELEFQDRWEREEQFEEREEMIRLIRSLRTTAAGFADDGPKTARALLQFLKRNELLPADSPILRLLRTARHMGRNVPAPEFLARLAEIREELLAQCVQEPFYRKPQPRVDIVELYNEARKLARPERNAEERILAWYLEQLEENPEAVNESLKKYCYVYSSTLQQSEGTEIQRAKGVRENQTLEYDTVIVDEAARANPCDLMISMAQARRRIILVGDHRQLPHIFDEEVFQELNRSDRVKNQADIRISMFQNLLDKVKLLEKEDGICRYVTLDAQYRMHPELGNFVSEQFYRPNGEGFDSPLPAELFAQSISREPLRWLDVRDGADVRPSGSRSRCRMSEVDQIVKCLEENLSDEACKDLKFGVISFYRAQVDAIKRQIDRSKILKAGRDSGRLRVGTVDAFQGMEFDVIYLSVVRAELKISADDRSRLFAAADLVKAGTVSEESEEYRNAQDTIDEIGQRTFGFITSKNRLCVALSRQKRLLVVVGSSRLFGTGQNGAFVPCRETEICVPAMVELYKKCLEKGVVQECRR